MKKLLFLLLSLCIISHSFAQINVNGLVLDSLSNPLSFANIQIFQDSSSSLVNYDVTDEQGRFSISLKKTGAFQVKASYLGYKEMIKSIYINSESTEINLEFLLKENPLSLYEVIVSEKAPELTINGDTVKYNLDRFTNGSEETLGNVLNKLPGIEVDENGKIKAHGKRIDKLLIDGEEFFNDQHQLATENISADMLKDVELLHKYQEFSAITNLEESNQTALNVNIKDSFKGKITGDVAAEYGYQDRYLAHSNLFRFARKSKLSIIGDFNNTGNQAISFEDYLNFQGGVKQFMKNKGADQVLILDEQALPKYLLSQDGIKAKKAGFGGINFVYHPFKFLKLKAHSILSYTQQEQQELSNTLFFAGTEILQTNEQSNNLGKFFFNTTTLDLDIKHDDYSILNYTLNFNPLIDHQNINTNQQILTNQNKFAEKIDNNNFSFGQQISYLRRLHDKALLTFNAYQDILDNKKFYQLAADRPFLELTFPNNNYALNQNIVRKKEEYGLNAKLAFKVKKSTFKFRMGTIFSKQSFNSNLNNFIQSDFDNQINLNRQTLYTGISYNFNHSIFHYTLGLDYYYFKTKYNTSLQDQVANLFPKLKFDLRFSSSHQFSLQYAYTNNLPGIDKTIQQQIVEDYRTIQANQNVSYDHIIPAHNYNLQYFILDFLTGTTLSFNASYKHKKNPINIMAESNPLVNKIAYRLVPFESDFSLYFLFDYKFQSIPFSSRFNLVYNQQNRLNYLAAEENKLNTKVYHGELKINSQFESELINFSLGFKLVNYQVNNELSNTTNELITLNPKVNLSGKFNSKFKWYLDASYEKYRSDSASTRTRFILSPSLRYRKNKSKYEFSLVGNNILNLNNTELIKRTTKINYVQEIIFSSLAGYVNFNIKYRF